MIPVPRLFVWAGIAFLVMAAPPLCGPAAEAGLISQAAAQESRVMQENDRDAMREWAHRRYRELESGSEVDLRGIPHSRDTERLWALYFLSVQEKDWEAPALALADTLSHRDLPEALQIGALAGALEVVRAKHSRWPPNKLEHLRSGLAMLDRLVEEAPQDPVVRYLRLMSCYYLPFFLDEDESVEDDLRVLLSILPDQRQAFSPPVYDAVVRFVLENGAPDPEQRIRLGAALEGLRDPVNSGGRLP